MSPSLECSSFKFIPLFFILSKTNKHNILCSCFLDKVRLMPDVLWPYKWPLSGGIFFQLTKCAWVLCKLQLCAIKYQCRYTFNGSTVSYWIWNLLCVCVCVLCQSASHQREFLTSSNNATQKIPFTHTRIKESLEATNNMWDIPLEESIATNTQQCLKLWYITITLRRERFWCFFDRAS